VALRSVHDRISEEARAVSGQIGCCRQIFRLTVVGGRSGATGPVSCSATLDDPGDFPATLCGLDIPPRAILSENFTRCLARSTQV
jgi:hypothetical protein